MANHSSTRIGQRLPLTFMAGCLARTPFRDQVAGAASAGFEAVSIWPNIWRHAQRKHGLSLRDMRAMLDDHGLRLTDVDAYRDWAPPPSDAAGNLGPTSAGVSLDEILEICDALGARTIVAVHLTDAAFDFSREVESFARLCESAARHDVKVGLEFIAFSQISDAETAWRVVDKAGQDNGGLIVDLWHHVRGAGRGDDALIRAVPAARIFGVQYCDAPSHSPLPLVEEAMFHRRMPGEGDWNVPGFLAMLDEMGVQAPCGPELYDPAFETQSPAQVMARLAAAGRDMLARAA